MKEGSSQGKKPQQLPIDVGNILQEGGSDGVSSSVEDHPVPFNAEKRSQL